MDMELLLTYGPVLLMVVIFYFMLYRPQKKAQAKRQEMLEQIKSGDRIMTIGGMYGEVVDLGDKEVTVKIADGVNVKFARAAVNANITNQDEPAK